MSALVITVIVVLVVAAVAFGLLTAYADRSRGRRIEHDLERLHQRPDVRRRR